MSKARLDISLVPKRRASARKQVYRQVIESLRSTRALADDVIPRRNVMRANAPSPSHDGHGTNNTTQCVPGQTMAAVSTFVETQHLLAPRLQASNLGS